MKMKMLALSRSLDTRLNALLPSKPYKSGPLPWNDVPRHKQVRCNTDMEELFHKSFGPLIRLDYNTQLEEMLTIIAEKANKNNPFAGWEMCSTVRMNVRVHVYHRGQPKTQLLIETVFIRPCLQEFHIVDKILINLASKTLSHVVICIPLYFLAESIAMHGDRHNHIFEKIEIQHTQSWSYSFLKNEGKNTESKMKLVELPVHCDIKYPEAKLPNAKDMEDIAPVEWNWHAWALIAYKYEWNIPILNFYFCTGFERVGNELILLYLQDALQRLQQKIKSTVRRRE